MHNMKSPEYIFKIIIIFN